MKKIGYIGNFLSAYTKYVTATDHLCEAMEKEGYTVWKTASQKKKMARLLAMTWQLIRFRNKTEVVLLDVFSTSYFYYALWAGYLLQWFKIPYIAVLHGGNLPHRLKSNPQRSEKILGKAAALVAPSYYLKEALEQLGYRVIHIPNLLNISEYPFRRRAAIQPRLLWVRAFETTYHPEMAVKVVKRLQQKYPEANLCMVGPVKDASLERTKTLVQQYGLDEKVVVTGVLTKKEWHQRSESCDILINTTTVDNTPVSVMEAMALGLPVVSTNVGGMPYLIEHQKDGLLVASGDVEGMTHQIERLLLDPALVEELTKNARLKAEQWDTAIVMNQWNQLLNHV